MLRTAEHTDARGRDPAPRSIAKDGQHRGLIGMLLGEALTLLEEDRPAARRCIEHACSLVILPQDCERGRSSLLADWQVRRAKTFIADNLDSSLRIETVAKLVNLSASYFSRAFKATVGLSYSDYVADARIELAKRLLLTTDMPIAEVALTCGLADQSHLTRLFSRSVGLPPSAWRRRLAGSVIEFGSRDALIGAA